MATVSVEVKKSQHRYVIGPKGNSINEILSETGVYVEMPSSDSTSETITLRGPQEKLGLGNGRTNFFTIYRYLRMITKILKLHVSCDLMSLKFDIKSV